MKILVDSREQAPLTFKVGEVVKAVEVRGLPWADYWCEIDGRELPVSFERKSIGDLFGTLTGGMERFKREIERARDMECAFYLAIEGTMSEVYAGYKHSTVPGERIIKTIMTLRVKYGVEPIFCNNREEMKAQIVETFSAIERNWRK